MAKTWFRVSEWLAPFVCFQSVPSRNVKQLNIKASVMPQLHQGSMNIAISKPSKLKRDTEVGEQLEA